MEAVDGQPANNDVGRGVESRDAPRTERGLIISLARRPPGASALLGFQQKRWRDLSVALRSRLRLIGTQPKPRCMKHPQKSRVTGQFRDITRSTPTDNQGKSLSPRLDNTISVIEGCQQPRFALSTTRQSGCGLSTFLESPQASIYARI